MSAGLPAAIGEIIDGYQLDAVVGQGAMGCVYAATHVKLRSRAAVKILGRDVTSDRELITRWMKDARISSGLRHPNIAEVIGFVDEVQHQRLSCVTELIGGPAIPALLRAHPLSTRQAIGIILQVCAALEAAHKAGVVHRDLKPGNVALTGAFDESGVAIPTVKLTDFGIPRITTLGAARKLLGTPAYMAPEQIAGGTAGTAADVYAIGELLYELLTRERLFVGADRDVLESKISAPPPGVRLSGVEHPLELARIISATLARAEAERPTMPELKERLGALLEQLPERTDDLAAEEAPPTQLELAGIVMEAPIDEAPLDAAPDDDDLDDAVTRKALVGDLVSPPPGAQVDAVPRAKDPARVRSTLPPAPARSTVPPAPVGSTLPPAPARTPVPPAPVRSAAPPAPVRSTVPRASSAVASSASGVPRPAPVVSPSSASASVVPRPSSVVSPSPASASVVPRPSSVVASSASPASSRPRAASVVSSRPSPAAADAARPSSSSPPAAEETPSTDFYHRAILAGMEADDDAPPAPPSSEVFATRAQVRRPSELAVGARRATYDGPIIDTSAVAISAEQVTSRRPTYDGPVIDVGSPSQPASPSRRPTYDGPAIDALPMSADPHATPSRRPTYDGPAPDPTALGSTPPTPSRRPTYDGPAPSVGTPSQPPGAARRPTWDAPISAVPSSTPSPAATPAPPAPAQAVLPRPPGLAPAPLMLRGPELADGATTRPTIDDSVPPPAAEEPPRPRRRLVVLSIIAAAMLIASIALVLVPELSSRATKAVKRRADRMAAGPNVVKNPLLEDVEHWRVHHTVDTKTVNEHLEEARRISQEDSWRASQAAEVDIKLALLIEPNNPRAIAMYLENRFLWRAALIPAEEQRKMQDAIVFSVSHAANTPDVLRAGAAMARMRGDAERCRDHASQALTQMPGDARTRLLVAWCELDSAPLRAIETAEQVASTNPELREVHRLLARAYANVGRYGSALKTLDERLKNDPNGGRAMLLRGDLQSELGRFVEAEHDYQLATNAEPENPLPRLGLAAAQLEQGKVKQAMMLYKLVTANRSASDALKAAANVGAARAYVAMGDVERAEQCVQAALAAGGDGPEVHLIAAELALARGALDQAKEHAERAVAQAAASSGPLAMRGRVLLAERRLSESLADLQLALQADPRDHRMRAIVVASALTGGAPGVARAVLEDALHYDPSGLYANAVDLPLELPYTVLRAAEAELAIEAKKKPHGLEARAAQGLLHYALGRTSEAAAAFADVATATTSVRRLATAFDAQLALDQGQLPRAEKGVAVLLHDDATSYVGHLLAGRIAARKKDLSGARDAFQAALASYPEGIGATTELAALQLQGTAKEGREAALTSLTELFRTYPRVIRIRQLLADAGH